MKIPSLTPEQMRKVDETVPEKYGISQEKLMEQAGTRLAEFLRKECGPEESIVVVAGKGNNGGDGLVATRILHNWGFNVSYVLAENPVGLAEKEIETVEALEVEQVDEIGEPDVIVDALLGYGINGDPRPPYDSLVKEMNSSGAKVVSVDVPTGLDAETGEKMSPAVEPDYTITFGLPKTGMSRENSGGIYVGDISIPPEIYKKYGIEHANFFKDSSLVKLE